MAEVINAVKESQLDEVYNLVAQFFIAQSSSEPVASANIIGVAVANKL